MPNSIPAALADYDPAKVLAAVEKIDGSKKDPFFEVWLKVVNRRIMRRIGLSMYDLADAPYWDYYEDGLSPREAADLVMEADDTFGFLFE